MDVDIIEYRRKLPKRTLQYLRDKVPKCTKPIATHIKRNESKYIVYGYIKRMESFLNINIPILINNVLLKYYNYYQYDIANVTFRSKPRSSLKSLQTYINYGCLSNNIQNENDSNIKENNDETDSMIFIMNDNQTQTLINEELEIVDIDNSDCDKIDFDLFFNQRKQTFDKMIKINKNKNHCFITLRFLTWNIWYNTKIGQVDRIKAIGDIIECNNCDVICLQEVTYLTLEMIKQSKWFIYGGYQSIDISHLLAPQFGAKHRKYWNVIITKHEFNSNQLHWKQFNRTSMIRHLILIPIKLKYYDKIVYIATSHLKSAVGKDANKNSCDRKKELKMCMDVLNDRNLCKNDNIIFGADFNWCEPTKYKQNDGDITEYLSEYWIDGYKEIYPNDTGYTYDAPSNAMLTSNLSGRLDRILYRKANNELTLKSIKIVGREAIPNLNYHKVAKRNGKEVHQILSVLPSDHYGLCADFVLRE